MNRVFRFVLCAALLLLPATLKAADPADDYPSGPITAVCTYSVGSQTDVQARIGAMPAEKYFGQPIVILNKAGAGGLTGWNWFMDRGSRDGLTILLQACIKFAQATLFHTECGWRAKYMPAR